MTGLQPVSFKQGRRHEPRISPPYVPGKHDKRFWTEAERQIIRKYYPEGGVTACLTHLDEHRTPSGVYQQAGRLGLTSTAKNPHKGHFNATPDVDRKIREAWPLMSGKKRGEVAELADQLGVPRWWLTKRAIKLGLTIQHKKQPPWTAAENALMEKAPLHEPDKAAKLFREHGFRRSPTAIMVQAKRLGLSRRAARKTLSASAAAKILGVDSKWVTERCISGALKASRRNDRRRTQQGGSAWEISRADLRQYILDNLEMVDLRKVEKFAFVDLIATQPETGT